MAMPSLHQRKCPFFFSISLLFLSVTILLFLSNSHYTPFSLLRISSSTSTSTSTSPSSFSSPPPILSDPPEPKPQPQHILSPPNSEQIESVPILSPIHQSRSSSGIVVTNIEFDEDLVNLKWSVCKLKVKGKESAVVDYIPCLDNWKAIKKLKSRKHMEHRQRLCPKPNPRCLVPVPRGYKVPIQWPKSRDMIWYDNVPHPKLVDYKKDQNWVVKSDDYFVFPGGGTQFRVGVATYISFLEKAVPVIKWGQNIRVVLDVGCGVASFGGYLLDRDVLTMSFAPKDEHEAQIQFALERGIPATLSVIGTQQLTFPDNAFDLIHCARCRVHWHGDGGKPLLELNRILRPGGFFIWSATPVYRNDEKHVNVWNTMVALTESMCWMAVSKTLTSTRVGFVVYQKPVSSSCYTNRIVDDPPMCKEVDRSFSWYTPLRRCLLQLPLQASSWPPLWPKRLTTKPLSLSSDRLVEETFTNETNYWATLVSDVYLGGLGINWSSVRNVMDMTAGYGGFAAALINMPMWVMNVVPVHESDTLSLIFERGLIGVYHDWCESFNTYPRTYDLLHSTSLFSSLPNRCDIIDLVAEMDRIVRPGGWILIQESKHMINKIASIFHSLQWSVNLYNDRFLVGKKSFWRPVGGKVQR